MCVWRSIVVLGGIAILGCGSSDGSKEYRATVRSARDVLPIAVEMQRLFKTADHYISHYRFLDEPTHTWNTNVFFGDRYELTMQVEVSVDYKKNCIAVVGEPVFYLWEVVSVNGREARIGENFTFSKDEWKRVHESGGEFSTIGIILNPNPVPGFADYAEALRKSREAAINLLENE